MTESFSHPEWFQFIECPFQRSEGYKGRYKETVSCIPPGKAYCGGSNMIPKDHPSYLLRKQISDALGCLPAKKDVFPGNTQTSELHQYEKLNNQLIAAICNGQVDPKHEIVTVHDDNSFESKQSSFDEMKVLSDYYLPSHSGFFNGDVRIFLKRNCSMPFDIVLSGSKHNN